MAANNRIFYACQLVGLSEMGTSPTNLHSKCTAAHGVQSVGITTNFNLEQAFELGQIQIYENIEGLPDVEVTLEKVLDGYPLLYHLATPNPESVGLVGRGKARADVALGIYSDGVDSVTDSGNIHYGGGAEGGFPAVEVFCSGMYMGSISYTVPVDGNATESVTLVGNNKEWIVATGSMHITSSGTGFGEDATLGGSATADSPKALTGTSGGVQRRENVMLNRTELPVGIYGVSGAGKGNAFPKGTTIKTAGLNTEAPAVHIQNFSVSTDFSREDILELGRKTPYFRAPGFPIEVTCDIEAIAVSGDFIASYELGDPTLFDTTASGDNTGEETILMTLMDGTVFDLGTNNRLSSVSYGGGDAAGGNVSLTYSYTNFNSLNVLHSQDPAKKTNGKYSAAQKSLVRGWAMS